MMSFQLLFSIDTVRKAQAIPQKRRNPRLGRRPVYPNATQPIIPLPLQNRDTRNT